MSEIKGIIGYEDGDIYAIAKQLTHESSPVVMAEKLEKVIIGAQKRVKNLGVLADVVVPKGTFCECEAPLIRAGNNTNGYCGSCGKDLN